MTDIQTNQQPDLQRNPPYEEEEINLVDLLRVIWKWKWLIVAGPLLCAVIAAVISFQMPKIYEVSTIIEPAIAMVQDNGNFLYFDSVANISGKIRGAVYNQEIKKTLGLDSPKIGIKFNPVPIQGTNAIRVISEWKAGETDLGVKVTQQLNSLVFNDYAKSVELKKEGYDTQIATKQKAIDEIKAQGKDIDGQIELMVSEVEKKRSEIKRRQDSLENIRQRQEELVKEIERVKKNMEQMIQQRDALLKDKNPESNISLVLYSTVIQQNMIHFDQLNNRVYDLSMQEIQTKAESDRLHREIDNMKADMKRLGLKKTEVQRDILGIEGAIEKLRLDKQFVRNIAVLAGPETSPYPVKPDTKKIVFLTGFVSLLIFVFLVFSIEYTTTHSKKSKVE